MRAKDTKPHCNDWRCRDLAWHYKVARMKVTDINEHLLNLWGFAREGSINHVTEMGVGDITGIGASSTTAFLHARPRRLVSYDILPCPYTKARMDRLSGHTNYSFIQGDSRDVTIEPTDLLFIDTLHTYDQLRVELRRHSGKVSKYIILHDTVKYADVGGDIPGFIEGSKGLRLAIQEFLAEGNFRVKVHFLHQNGLMVLERTAPRDPVACPPYRQFPDKPRRAKVIARCTPTLGNLHCWWVQAVEGLLWPFNSGSCLLFLRDEEGGEIAECRNGLAQTVIDAETDQREMSHIFWIDDDVVVPRGALVQLLSHDRDIASGVYFGKVPGRGAEPLVFDGPCAGSARFKPDEIREAWGHGMGLTLVRTEVYRKLRDEFDLLPDKYGNPEWYRTLGRVEDLELSDDRSMLTVGATEDLYFLDKTEQLGYRSLVDMTKHAFGWHLDTGALKGYPEEQWKQYQESQPVIWQGMGPNGENVVWD